MSLPSFTHAESCAESYRRPRLDIFQTADSPTYIDLHWRGGHASGADLVCAIIEGCALTGLALCVNHASSADRSSTIGATGAEAIEAIRRAVAFKAERAA
jgi:hypothetical protein